jgi:hypothetical protein
METDAHSRAISNGSQSLTVGIAQQHLVEDFSIDFQRRV